MSLKGASEILGKHLVTYGGHAPGIGGSSKTYVAGSLNSIVKPFSERVQHILDRIEKRREIAGESQESTLCIGGPANFELSGVRIDWPTDHDEEEEGITRGRYKELQAVTRIVRVTNPTDDENWVDVRARNSSLIQNDKGGEFWIDWLQNLP